MSKLILRTKDRGAKRKRKPLEEDDWKAPGIVFRLPGKVHHRDESTAGTISLISLGMKSQQKSVVWENRMLRSTWWELETGHGRNAVTLADEKARQRGKQTST